MLIFQRRRQGRESDLLSAGRGRCFACRSCVFTIAWLTTLFPNILPPPCLRYNLLNPKPTLITFGNNYNRMRILFPFTVALCTLTSARSMSIQFWLKFTVENKKEVTWKSSQTTGETPFWSFSYYHSEGYAYLSAWLMHYTGYLYVYTVYHKKDPDILAITLVRAVRFL